MTAAENREARAAVRGAWRELEALAAAMRPEWERPPWDIGGLKSAMRTAYDAGWGFERVAVEVWRLIWDPGGEPSDLRNAVRAERPQPARGPEVNGRGRDLARRMYKARHEAGAREKEKPVTGDGSAAGDRTGRDART